MMKGTLGTLALVAGCAVALTAPAVQAQTLDMQSSMYERLLQPNNAELRSRILRECGPITNTHLRTGCVDSLAIEEDQRSMGLRDGLTGGGDGRTNPIDRTFQGPEMYDPRLGR